MTRQLPLFMLAALLLSAAPAFARTMPLQNANGEEVVCPEEAAQAGETSEDPTDKPVVKRSAPVTPAKNKPVAPLRGNGNNPARPPRWHRFLPGMFR